MSFSVPRAGTITDITAYFSVVLGLSLIGTTMTVHAQLYESTTPDNIFSPIAGTDLALAPDFSDTIIVGETANATLSGLSIPVAAGTRLLMVFTLNSSGVSLLNTLTGYASGGVNIV